MTWLENTFWGRLHHTQEKYIRQRDELLAVAKAANVVEQAVVDAIMKGDKNSLRKLGIANTELTIALANLSDDVKELMNDDET